MATKNRINGNIVIVAAAIAALAPLAANAESYKVVEYVASSGTQYIDTGISVTKNTRMVCDFQFTEAPLVTARCGWNGSGANDSVAFFFGVSLINKNGNYVATNGTPVFAACAAMTVSSGYVVERPANDTFDLERHTFDIAKGSLKFDGVEFSTINTLAWYENNANGHIWLFAGRYNTSTDVQYPCSMKIFSCQIYSGEMLIRDFMPVVRTSDNTPGLYDRVTGIFFVNSGTGTLTYGGEPHDVPSNINPSYFNYSMRIKPSAGVLTSSLANFPVLVRLSDAIEGFSYETCKQDELRFALPDGTLLASEVDTWNTNGESTVWVSIPYLSPVTVFHAYWGLRPRRGIPQVSWENTWQSASYKSVWHMGIDDGFTPDSANAYSAAVENPNEYCGSGTGVVGGCYHNEENWNPSTSKGVRHGIDTTASTGFSADSATPAIATFSGWVRQIGGTMKSGLPDATNYPRIKWTDSYGNCGTFINTRNGAIDGNCGFLISLAGKNGVVQDGTDWGKFIAIRNYESDGKDSKKYGGELDIGSLFDKAWHHMVVRFDGTNRNFFLDGVLQTSCTAAAYHGVIASGIKVVMGKRSKDSSSNCVWTGDLDEFRFRSVSSSDEWIAAEYASQANPNFLTHGPVNSGFGFAIVVR